ncbi:kynurenine formamidase isoform X2 [Ranitomeya imitator]|uniref:kynurenine formamidase isoform X2 n=1 Tax=Ranitomeya imitator TaxID=111125 RepID=UPI0037E81FC5
MEDWRKLGKEELEHQYSPSHWSHRMDKDAVIDAHVKEITEGTNLSRVVARTALNIQYGDSDSEKMDLYLPEGEPTKLPFLVYIHGGYWQFLSKEESGFMAAPLVSNGIAVMVMDYDIAPKAVKHDESRRPDDQIKFWTSSNDQRCHSGILIAAACQTQRDRYPGHCNVTDRCRSRWKVAQCEGDMDLIVAQVRRSIASIFHLYPHNAGIYLCGHSAGAHLVAMTLCTDWTEYKVIPDIKGALLVSGVYDLLPIIDTYVNDALKMSQEVALKNSPMQYGRHMNAGTCQVVIAVAEHDSPEFHRQSQQYFQSLMESGLDVSYVLVDGTDHFNVIEKLSQEAYGLTQLILKMILKH